jgi:membrane protein
VAVSLVLNVGVFWLGFRLAVQPEIKARQMLPGAVLSAIVWQILQLLGTYLVSHTVSKSSSTYGVFAVVLGLLAWLYLQAQFTLYAVEANVVSVRRLWPRSLAPPPFTPEDLRAFDIYAKMQERRREVNIETRVASPVRQTSDPEQPAEDSPAAGRAAGGNASGGSAPEDSAPEDSAPEDRAARDSTVRDRAARDSTAGDDAPKRSAPRSLGS